MKKFLTLTMAIGLMNIAIADDNPVGDSFGSVAESTVATIGAASTTGGMAGSSVASTGALTLDSSSEVVGSEGIIYDDAREDALIVRDECIDFKQEVMDQVCYSETANPRLKQLVLDMRVVDPEMNNYEAIIEILD